MDRLHRWAVFNCSPMPQCRLGEECLEKLPEGKGPGNVRQQKLNMSQHWAKVAKHGLLQKHWGQPLWMSHCWECTLNTVFSFWPLVTRVCSCSSMGILQPRWFYDSTILRFHDTKVIEHLIWNYQKKIAITVFPKHQVPHVHIFIPDSKCIQFLEVSICSSFMWRVFLIVL